MRVSPVPSASVAALEAAPPNAASKALSVEPVTTWELDGIRLFHYHWPAKCATAPVGLPPSVVGLLLGLRGQCRVRVAAEPSLVFDLTAPQHALLYAGATGVALGAEVADTEALVLAWPIAGFVAAARELAAPLTSFAATAQAGQVTTVGPVPLSPRLALAGRALLADAPAGALRPLWRRARLWEVVAEQLAALERSAPLHQLSEYDQERLRFARDYLLHHTSLPPSLPELARVAGLNEHKLKQGFKALFGMPAFAYLAEWRLVEARQRLRADAALTASEVAFELGFASLQHFSAAFKKRFHSPRILRTT